MHIPRKILYIYVVVITILSPFIVRLIEKLTGWIINDNSWASYLYYIIFGLIFGTLFILAYFIKEIFKEKFKRSSS